jgi:hypothetical protein
VRVLTCDRRWQKSLNKINRAGDTKTAKNLSQVRTLDQVRRVTIILATLSILRRESEA